MASTLSRVWRSALPVLAATVGIACLAAAYAAADATSRSTGTGEQTAQSEPGDNGPDDRTRAWIQASLDNWETICRQHLRIELEPLPWMIFYDERQSWHLAADENLLPPHQRLVTSFLFNGRPRRLVRVTHDKMSVWLPSGTLPIGAGKTPQAFAMPYDSGTKAFFVLALPSVIQASAGGRPQNLDNLLLGLTAHELAHTRQLVDVMRRIKALRQTHDVPIGIDDNFIQKTYSADQEYARLFSEEGTTYYRAAMEDADGETSRRLLREALSLSERRRARFFTGARAVHGELDDIFLVMEGVGEWARFQIKRRQAPPASSWHRTLNEMMAEDDAWSQQQGLVLFLLIDRLVPNWQARFLSPNFPSPFAVLREALEASPAKPRSRDDVLGR